MLVESLATRDKEREPPGKAALSSLPFHGVGGLLLHQKLHYNLSTIRHRRTRAEDGGDTGFVEEVIVLRGDDTTGGDHDIRTAEFLELLDDLRDEGLVTCRKRGDTQYMDIVLLVGSGDP